MSVIIERLELTDEQVRFASNHAKQCAAPCGDIAKVIVAALPKPTLRERAYKVSMLPGNYGGTDWDTDMWAVMHMARWLYENAGEERWSLQHARTYTSGPWAYEAFCGASVETYDSLVDAYAHVVVGLGESS